MCLAATQQLWPDPAYRRLVRRVYGRQAYVYGLSNSLALDSAGNRLDQMVELYASVMGKNVADRAIVLGGYGYVGEYHVGAPGVMQNS